MGCEGPALWSLRGHFSTDGELYMHADRQYFHTLTVKVTEEQKELVYQTLPYEYYTYVWKYCPRKIAKIMSEVCR